MKKTWKPKVAGILLIILGIPEMALGAMYAILALEKVISGSWRLIESLAWALPLMFVGTTAVTAGVYALRRKRRGLVLAASMCTLSACALGVVLLAEVSFVVFLAGTIGAILGVLAMIFVMMGRGEFEGRAKLVVGAELCPACGAPTATPAETCANCGARLAEAVRPRTRKPKAGGILAIVAGVLVIWTYLELFFFSSGIGFPPWPTIVIAVLHLLVVLSGTVAIVGGIYAIRRRAWGLVLAGSICALTVSTVLVIILFRPYVIVFLIPGILALVLIIKGKREFG
jgi:hypothetical protein